MQAIKEDIKAKLMQAFILGFSISREGFNGECAYEHLAPRSINDMPRASHDSLSELIQETITNAEFIRLMNEALAYMESKK